MKYQSTGKIASTTPEIPPTTNIPMNPAAKNSGVFITIVLGLKRGTVAGPDPWKANTLEWFTPSPPPENNFDVVPRVRSVEPMKDFRRQIEQQTGVPQRYQPGRPLVGR